jgi:hypothetical protein
LHLNTVLIEVGDSVGTTETTVDDHHLDDASMMNEFGTHHAWFTGDYQPSTLGRNSICCRVTYQVHLGVVTTYLDHRSRPDFLAVPKAYIPTTQLSPSTWTTIVSIHQDHISFRVDQKSTELCPWTIARTSQSEALLDSNLQMLGFQPGHLSRP